MKDDANRIIFCCLSAILQDLGGVAGVVSSCAEARPPLLKFNA